MSEVVIKFKFDYQKAVHAVKYFLQYYPHGIANKDQILLRIFLADKLHLNKYGRTVSRDTYQLTDNGVQLKHLSGLMSPIGDKIEKTWDVYFSTRLTILPDGCIRDNEDSPLDRDVFSDSDLECFSTILNLYRGYGHDVKFKFELPVASLFEEGYSERVFQTAQIITESDAAF